MVSLNKNRFTIEFPVALHSHKMVTAFDGREVNEFGKDTSTGVIVVENF